MRNNAEIGLLIDDKYKVVSFLGEGGAGSVFKAEQEDLGRFVAIKLLQGQAVSKSDLKARFLREAQILARLDHPNIVKLYSFGFLEIDLPYMAMEYVDGKSLSSYIKEDNLNESDIIKIAIQVCRGLELAHKNEVIHRDLKPQNIMIAASSGSAKILDFGLSKMICDADTGQKLTQTGLLLGSVQYMSPEACMGQKADQRSDIYALGCILYECCTGIPPFSADNPIGLLHKHTSEKPQPFSKSSKNKRISKELELCILKCLQKSPGDRYTSCTELLNDLELIKEVRTDELSISNFERRNRKMPSPMVSAIATAGLLAAISLLVYAVCIQPSQRTPTDSFVWKGTQQLQHEHGALSIDFRIKNVAELTDKWATTSKGAATFANTVAELTEIINRHEVNDRDLLYDVYQIRGNCLSAQGHHLEAVADFRKALELSRTDSGEDTNGTMMTYCALAREFQWLGKEDEAIACARKSLTMYKKVETGDLPTLNLPTSAAVSPGSDCPGLALIVLADLASKHKSWNKAKEYYNEYTRLPGRELSPAGPLGIASLEIENSPAHLAKALQMVAKYKSLVDEHDEHPHTYFAIGEWYRQHNQPELAIKAYESCLIKAEQGKMTDHPSVRESKKALEELQKQLEKNSLKRNRGTEFSK